MKSDIYDEYDLLLELLGYNHENFQLVGSEHIVQTKFHDAYKLLKELGKADSSNVYKLYLHSTDIIEKERTISSLHQIMGYTNEDAAEKLTEAEKYFKIEIIEGCSRELYPKLYRLTQVGLKVTMEYFRRKY